MIGSAHPCWLNVLEPKPKYPDIHVNLSSQQKFSRNISYSSLYSVTICLSRHHSRTSKTKRRLTSIRHKTWWNQWKILLRQARMVWCGIYHQHKRGIASPCSRETETLRRKCWTYLILVQHAPL